MREATSAPYQYCVALWGVCNRINYLHGTDVGVVRMIRISSPCLLQTSALSAQPPISSPFSESAQSARNLRHCDHRIQMTHIALYNGLFFRLKYQKTLPIRGHDARYVQTIRASLKQPRVSLKQEEFSTFDHSVGLGSMQAPANQL